MLILHLIMVQTILQDYTDIYFKTYILMKTIETEALSVKTISSVFNFLQLKKRIKSQSYFTELLVHCHVKLIVSLLF